MTEKNLTRVERQPLVAHGDLPRQPTVLSERIERWLDDDDSGYDEAIDLLIAAAEKLKRLGE